MTTNDLQNDKSQRHVTQVHPLDAPSEQKLFHPALGRMTLTRPTKLVLFVLQGYLGVMVLLVGWHLIAGT